ncbi:ADP glucose pyrophosphorylase large subunit 1 isoform 6 [Theobroma cacao]|uniref:glucose-1-phosphate adenylyltransferase n=1 Tax=Theobroma cacao TaxID=3641 RepID=A0A061EKN0_THECC|nr:ADP glucose pyrophosphorylase large subunit 1 isoform 6 [Theobroma cacao]
MSNCINSGINKVYILTQFNSASLNRHLSRAYNFGNGVNFGDGYVETLSATQTPGEAGKRWFQGTADAVRQFHWLFEDARCREIEDVLILSGDHLYRMDYMDFVQNHRQSGADITISCLPIDDRRASDFGLMKIDNKGRILSFSEKPKGQELKAMAVDTTVLGLSRDEAEKKPYIASMGVYVFKKEILLNLLRWRFPTANDFGSEIIPASAKEFFIKAYLFNDYWEDIGTIRSFFEANLALTEHPPRFSFYDAAKPIYTSRRNLPPSKIDNSKVSESQSLTLLSTEWQKAKNVFPLASMLIRHETGLRCLKTCCCVPNFWASVFNSRLTFFFILLQLVDSIISHGSFLTDCFIEHSVVGIRSRINANVHLEDTVMLGADFYETGEEKVALLAEGGVPVGIGENTKIKDCIIDKNARIGKNVVIANSEGVQEADRSSEGFYIRSGITVLPARCK